MTDADVVKDGAQDGGDKGRGEACKVFKKQSVEKPRKTLTGARFDGIILKYL